jgi:hypothetical protein
MNDFMVNSMRKVGNRVRTAEGSLHIRDLVQLFSISSASSNIRNCAAESGMILSNSFDKDATGAPPENTLDRIYRINRKRMKDDGMLHAP